MDQFTKKGIILTFCLSFLLSLGAGLLKGPAWGMGTMAGALWSVVNFFLTTRLMSVAASKDNNKKRLAFLLFVKFPVLYGLGLLLIVSGFFPVYSLILGLFSIFIALRIVVLCLKPA
ncbi:MAG: hypothetical protein AUJ74_04620 [Candidatus Omnitrophica bacterium CG1_02_44_16]|nr:MAG: hypothetical protein AUJ74_04620 [Candidatus Omnitrophica bacterium CG1_02_44_16]PIY83129.1 MAG: hypothetical protein COY78_03230 [Candidatus Omnitrophica bacterium CG_4_10_14_0_8_um_filter_44_12]PIZ83843.1 MAG: hypothetical protein COX96_06620 [Candidatus Omnitrophica bacterium CG_4_10_14_0_2_um_filter_44_9]